MVVEVNRDRGPPKPKYVRRKVSEDVAPLETQTMLSKRRKAAGGRTAADLPPALGEPSRPISPAQLFQMDEDGNRIIPERVDPGSPRNPVISSMLSDKLKRRRGAATRRTARRRSGAPNTLITETDKIG